MTCDKLPRVEPQGAPTHQLTIREAFKHLPEREKLYAHYCSLAAWYGTRVILRQTSPEANDIFDFIIALHRSCKGRWLDLVVDGIITEEDLAGFLDYAALFLSNIGNYFADGGQKIIPRVSVDGLERLAGHLNATKSFSGVIRAMLSAEPSTFGYPSSTSQANYYPGEHQITEHEVGLVSKVLKAHNIEPENTRIKKWKDGSKRVFDVLQASADTTDTKNITQWDGVDGDDVLVRVLQGDHHNEMSSICKYLLKAKEFASNDHQTRAIDCYVESFRTGSLQAYRKSQEEWVKDKSPVVETVFGFVEPFRDPHGDRGEWEAVVFISDPAESLRLEKLIKQFDTFIIEMPWAVPGLNNGKGPFEKDSSKGGIDSIGVDGSSVHALASCSSIIWSGMCLPNYEDIKEKCGFKNLVVTNRIRAENDTASPCDYVSETEVKDYKRHVGLFNSTIVAVHEILGHGSGQLLSEKETGESNFDKENLPISTLTGKQVDTWYHPGETWTNVFGDIAMEVEECRAELMSLYLMGNPKLLTLLGHEVETSAKADDILYYTYLQIGVTGLGALESYNTEEQVWGEPHRSGQFAILKHLLLKGNGVLVVDYDETSSTLTVRANRDKLHSHGQPALGDLLHCLHVWRCTADVKPCTAFYKELSAVDGEYIKWKKAVDAKPHPRWKFVQANTFIGPDGSVGLKVYQESNEGIIQSWAEREV